MVLPFFSLFAVFYLWPLVYGVLISFTKWNGIEVPVYNGLANYFRIVADPKFSIAFGHLGIFILVVVPIGIGIALFLAILVAEQGKRTASVFKSLFFFPVIIPLFLSASIFRILLSPDPVGIVNVIVKALGGQDILWLKDPEIMVYAVCIVDIWRAVGFHFILLYAGIKGIPVEQSEAAEVDGASTFQRSLFITIPQLEPVLFLVIVNAFIGGLQAFDLPWLLSNSQWNSLAQPGYGMLFPVMDTIWRAWSMRQAFGEASAYAMIIMLITLVITALQFLWRQARLGRESL